MSEKYKLSILALTACLLTGCGAGETIVLENTTAEKQPTEPVAETSADTVFISSFAVPGNESKGVYP